MKTNEDLVSELIYNAEQGKHLQFQFLRNWREYRRTKAIRRTYALLVSSIRQSTDKQVSNYCKAIKAGNTDVLKLLAFATTVKILKFYEEELCILEDMLDEYEYYLFYGNWVDFIFGMDRPADKLYDHRSRAWKNTL